MLFRPEDEAKAIDLGAFLVDFRFLDNESATTTLCWTVRLFVHGLDDLMMKKSLREFRKEVVGLFDVWRRNHIRVEENFLEILQSIERLRIEALLDFGHVYDRDGVGVEIQI